MGRAPCCDKMGVKKGPWSPEEDRKLVNYILHHGFGNWRALPKQAGLLRCGKSCRLRWTNYLRPDLKRGNLSPEEEATVIALHNVLGNKWSTIASYLPGRTDNEIKNIWNTHIKKRLASASAPASTSDSASASFSASASASASSEVPAIKISVTDTNNECTQSQQSHVLQNSDDRSIHGWDFQEDNESREPQQSSTLDVKGVQSIESIEDFLLGSDAGYSEGDRIGEVSSEASISATTHEQNNQYEGMSQVNFSNEDLRDIEQELGLNSVSGDVFANPSPFPDFSYEWLVSEQPTDVNDDVFSPLWNLDE